MFLIIEARKQEVCQKALANQKFFPTELPDDPRGLRDLRNAAPQQRLAGCSGPALGRQSLKTAAIRRQFEVAPLTAFGTGMAYRREWRYTVLRHGITLERYAMIREVNED